MLITRTRFINALLVLLLSWQYAAAPNFADDTVSSKPVTAGQSTLILRTAKTWTVDAPVNLDFCITNNSKSSLVFPLFDTLTLIIKTPNGEFLPLIDGRRATRYVEPVLLAAGKTTTITRSGKLLVEKSPGRLSFDFNDQTGGKNLFIDMHPGDYDVSFQYSNREKSVTPHSNENKNLPVFHEACWVGNITTTPVRVNIAAHAGTEP
jgi:hypothetical protein